ncbi:hypothetical protein HDU84_003146 [Entophlyctis sp. JEL0112]|nr:hypothetical protein HDU84_003146 [Entophlyctis sp. JEL0112]
MTAATATPALARAPHAACAARDAAPPDPDALPPIVPIRAAAARAPLGPEAVANGLPAKRLLPLDDAMAGTDCPPESDIAAEKSGMCTKAPRLDIDLPDGVPSSPNEDSINAADPRTNWPPRPPLLSASGSGFSAPFSFTREIGGEVAMPRVDSKFYDPPPLLLPAAEDSNHPSGDTESALESVGEEPLEEAPLIASPRPVVPGLAREKLRFSVLSGLSSGTFSPVLLPVIEETPSPAPSPAMHPPLSIKANAIPHQSADFNNLYLPTAVADFLSPALRVLVSNRLRPMLNNVAVQHDVLARTHPMLTAGIKWSAICAFTPAVFLVAIMAAVICAPGLFAAGIAWVLLVVAYRGFDAATASVHQMSDSVGQRILSFTGHFSESFTVASENASGLLKMFLSISNPNYNAREVAPDAFFGDQNASSSPSVCNCQQTQTTQRN